jgi:tRNA(fMet)-specific endonuclease VapC
MSYLLDTDICSAYLQGQPDVFNRFLQHSGGLYVSIVSLAEVYSWVYVVDDPRSREEGLMTMLSDVSVLGVDDDVARTCGQVRAKLQRRGIRVPTVDLLIASTALLHDFTMVTHNQRHFRLVPDLRIEDWLINTRSS